MVQNAPPKLNFIDKMSFSYPANIEYPNSIAFSGIQSGVLMAYSSGNLIIVLSHCEYVKAILSDHKGIIISITFEMRGPHIIACDVYGTYYFWHYNDTGYEKSRVVDFGIPATCITWFPARREIALSTKKGLLFGGIHNFVKSSFTKLGSRSTFCQFNSDGTLLASHHNSVIVTFYIFSSSIMMTQVVRHLNPVVQFDFHPYLPIFISITTDLNLHIWRLSNSTNFVCTSMIKVNSLCKFIKYPIYYLERMKTDQKPAEIAFIDHNCKISSIKIDRNGQVLNEDKIHFNTSNSPQFHLVSVYKTNFGIKAAIIQENGILITSKGGQTNQILYHTSSISQISFQEKESWIFTLDKLGSLIVWPIYDTNYSSYIVSHNASHAAWYNDELLLLIHFDQLVLYNIHNSEIENLQFPKFSNCIEIFVDKKETVYVLTRSTIILKDSQHEIPEFSHHSFSQVFDDHFLLVLLSKTTSQFKVFMFPEFIEIKCDPRTSKSCVKSIACLTIDSFAVLTEEGIEFWNYTKGSFIINATIQLSNMKYIKCCSSLLFACDENNVYLIENGVYPILQNVSASCITTDISGSIAYSHQKSFSVIPFPFHNKKNKNLEKIPSNAEILKLTTNNNEESSIKQVIRYPYNFLISPFDYTDPQEEQFNVIHSTFIHLLEYESLFDFVPRQIPAVPNQCAFHLTFPRSTQFTSNGRSYDFNFDGKDYLSTIDSNKKDGFDLFALRYLYSIRESALPLTYFGLWLSFSLHQSEISDYLIENIDSNDLTKFFIPLAIHDHRLLLNIVKSSVQRTWNAYQKVENVALLLIAMGQQLKVSKLYNVIGDTQRGDFFTHDFTTKRFRKSAIKNAYSSLCHGGYEMSAALFIIAGEVKTGITVITEKIRDPVLAFLILRLITNSDYESEIMKWFLSVARWEDDIIQIYISYLTKSDNLIELFEKALLETEKVKNISTFGDRRVPLFQLYHYLATRRNVGQIVLYQVARNLCYDGLAPLAIYLFRFADCPYTTARSILTDKPLDNEEKVQNEEKEVEEEQGGIISFDFGGANMMDVDDWSDSEQEEEESLNKNGQISEVTCEMKNELDIVKFEKSVLEIDSIVKNSIRKRSFYLSKFFVDSVSESSQQGSVAVCNVEDNDAGLIALRMCNIKLASKLFDDEMKFQLEVRIAKFIQFCSIRFLFSASVPSEPTDLYELSKLLLKMTTKREKAWIDYNLMCKLDRDGFSVFSFIGAFVVSLWTYHHKLLYRLLLGNESQIRNRNASKVRISEMQKQNEINKTESNNNNTDNVSISVCKNDESSIDNSSNVSIVSKSDSDIANEKIESITPPSNTSTNTNSNTNSNSSISTNTSSSTNSSTNTNSNSNSASVKVGTGAVSTAASNSDKSRSSKSSLNIKSMIAMLDEIPPPRSLFDIDFSASRFPDTMPSLLQHYLSESLHGLETALERDRLLIMYLIYSLMFNKFSTLYDFVSNRIGGVNSIVEEMYTKVTSLLEERKNSISKIIEFYQLALNCPSLSPPTSPKPNEIAPLNSFCVSIINEHIRSQKSLEKIQQRILRKMPISFVINWKLNIDESGVNKSIFKVPDTSIKGVVVAPLNSNMLIAASPNSVFSINLENSFVSEERNLNKSSSYDDPLQVIVHPRINLILIICPFNTTLYDFNSSAGTKVSINFKQKQGVKFTCAQFSPNGEKVAICSSSVEVYFFDLSTEYQSPFVEINVNGVVNSILWLNCDTFLIVAYTSNRDKSQKLALIDLLSSFVTPLPIDPALSGKINVMEIERRFGFLLLGTKSGKAAIVELVTLSDFKVKWIYDFKKVEVTAAAAFNNLYAFGTLDGDVLLANFENENGKNGNKVNMKLFKVQFAVSSIIIEMERIIVTGNANYIEVWKAGEYF